MIPTHTTRPSIFNAVTAVLAVAALLMLGSCQGVTTSAPGVNLAPFKAMARAAACSDRRNRLFLIDDRMVFWDREGNCMDALFTLALYGQTVSDLLCSRSDSVGGPNTTICTDESFRPMFETMISNLDDPALGLGPEHTVSDVPF